MARETQEKNLPVMTREELKNYDGQNGHKTYIAFRGKIYDVSESLWWDGGMHQGEHVAGHDASEEMDAAPHSFEVLKSFKVVAELKQE